MSKKWLAIIFLLFFTYQGVNAQYSKLFSLTEKGVIQSLKEFPIVERDSLRHEMLSYLVFKNSKKELKLVCYFFLDKCNSVQISSSPSTYADAVKYANDTYHHVRDNIWISHDSMYTISIYNSPDKVVTYYHQGVSRF